MLSEQQIIAYACTLREQVGHDRTSPIESIEEVIRIAGYQLQEESFGDEFSGFSCMVGPMEYLIGFNTDHNWSRGFRRFTLAHELGHLTIPHHVEMLEGIRIHRSKPEFQSGNAVEREADLFATNFLAPRSAAANQTKGYDFTRGAVEHLAAYFGLSLYSAAHRFVETTDLACSLVVCDGNGRVVYEKRSRSMENSLRHSFINGARVSRYTLASDYISGNTSENDVDIRLNDWYPNLEQDVEAKESVLALGYNGRYLAMLTPYHTDF